MDSIDACYPEQGREDGPVDQGVQSILIAALGPRQPPRFVRPTRRGTVAVAFNGWAFPSYSRPAMAAQVLTHRGLIMIKSPFDLALYTRLIWELQPHTILELGSFHGGSALWLIEQASVLCQVQPGLHSFDLFPQCVSPVATHPWVEFHRADLTRPADAFDPGMLAALPHPWLVIDDAHVNVLGVFGFLDEFMSPGDYYVSEDLQTVISPIVGAAALDEAGYMVDTHYTDAFGLNVTSAPNGWLRKV